MIIVAGPTRVVESGSVTAFNGHPLRLIPSGGPAVTLSFDERDSSGEPSVDVAREATGWQFTLHNFAGTEGRGTSVPVYLGDVAGFGWFLHFRVFRYGNTADHTLLFTFYVGDPGGEPAPVEAAGTSG